MTDENFDFESAEELPSVNDPDFLETSEMDSDETATSGNPVNAVGGDSGKPTPEIIALARKLAGSPKGLNIDEFFTKYHISVDIETLLNGPLDKDGNLL